MPSCVEINRRVDGVNFCFRTATRHLQPGDDVPHRVVVVVARRPRDGRAHAVLVVLNTKNHGQFPQGGHVHGLPDLALVRRAVAVAADRDGHRLAQGRLVLVPVQPNGGHDDVQRVAEALPEGRDVARLLDVLHQERARRAPDKIPPQLPQLLPVVLLDGVDPDVGEPRRPLEVPLLVLVRAPADDLCGNQPVCRVHPTILH